jgi:hypothetical protein
MVHTNQYRTKQVYCASIYLCTCYKKSFPIFEPFHLRLTLKFARSAIMIKKEKILVKKLLLKKKQ